MADRDITTRAGKGSALTSANYDQNVNGLNGTVDAVVSATYEVVYTDQGKTLELNNASMVCTLDNIADIEALIDTDNFLVRLRNINAAEATVNATTDTIDGDSSITLQQDESVVLQTNAAGDEWGIVSRKIDTYYKTQTWSKGADVASANALSPGSDGNYFDVTGTTSITSIASLGIGTVIKLHFDAALTLTHNATDLVLPGAKSITTATGDEAEFIEYADGDWRLTNYQRAAGKTSAHAYGRVSVAGAKQGGYAFTSLQQNTGRYKITLTTPLDDTSPAVLVSVQAGSVLKAATYEIVDSSTIRIWTWDVATAAVEDQPFSFAIYNSGQGL
jgi:hypothetical protein